MIGSDLEADIIVTYEKAMGKLAFKPQKQAISQEPGNSTEHISWETTRAYAIPAHLGADFGYLASYVGYDYGLVSETSDDGILSFVEYGTLFSSLVGEPATSFVLTAYNSDKISSSTYLGYLSWMDSIKLMPY